MELLPKVLYISGMSISIIGTILVGFVAPGGIPKRGDPINAPKRKISFAGWVTILLGFILMLISAILS
jgi:hypothetical protein